MLTVAKVTSGQAPGYAIYLDARTQAPELGDYYLREGERIEAPGRWITGAQLIGCDPEAAVSGGQLRALMAVKHPATGLPLRRVGGNGQAVSALDLTFSAPKSVSAVWALASPELRSQIETAHETAVDQALTYATQQVPMVRRRVDRTRVDHVLAAGLVATSWRHSTARAVKAQLPDPQLHSHVLLHAAVRSGGELVAIDSRSVFVHRRELGAAYRTTLAHQLTQLGFQVQRGTGRGQRYFELSGVPAGLIEQWSSRHHQVHHAIAQRLADKRQTLEALVAAGGPDARAAVSSLEALDRSGRLLPSEERFMATHTRAPKNPRTHGDLDQHWHQDARQHDFDTLAVERLRGPSQTLKPATGAQLLERLTEFDATFSDREARAVALEACAGATIETALESLDSLDRAGVLLDLADGRQTTTRHRATEQRTVTIAQRLAEQRPSPLPPALVSHQALALDAELKAHGAQLSDEQHQALQLACSDRALVMIEGQAGTGKSTTLTAIARAHQADGRQIVVTSTAALAAQHLAAELAGAGVNAPAYSTAALQAAVNAGTLTLDERTTVIHDEAALASTREQHQVLTAVEASGARLILIGDPRQNQAVGAGGLWPDLEHATKANGAHVRLTQIVRAVDPADRRDQTMFRQGQHQRALTGYSDRGRVHLTDTQQLAEDHALDAAHHDRQAGRQTLVICQTSNEHLDALNARAQAIRHQHGELGEHTLPLTGRPYGLRSGDHVQIRHPLDHPDLGRVANGTTAHVLDIDQDGQAVLELADGRSAAFTSQQADAASVRLAYVSHPFPAQGHTTDTTHLIVAEHTTSEGSYVALTRARQQTHIHASHALLADVEPVHQPEPAGQPERDRSGQLELFTDQPDHDPLEALAARMGRSQPEIASIRTPLAHEQHPARQQARATGLGIDPGAGAHDTGNRGEHEHPPGPEHQQPQLPGPERSINHTPEHDNDREHDAEREHDDAERELAGRLARARQARDDAQRVLDTYPAAHAHQHRLAQQKLQQTAQDLANCEARAQRLKAQLDQLGPIARRREPGQQLKAQLKHNDSAITSLDRQLIELDRDAEIHQQIVGAWETDHPDARERVKTAERELDVLIEQEARRRLERPGEHLTRALGRPPGPEHPQRGLWDRTALQIERYRTRYQINPNDPAPLGQEPEPGSHTRQQRDQLEHARAQITLASTRLGTRAPQPGQAIDPPALTHPAPHRGIDRGGFSIGL